MVSAHRLCCNTTYTKIQVPFQAFKGKQSKKLYSFCKKSPSTLLSMQEKYQHSEDSAEKVCLPIPD